MSTTVRPRAAEPAAPPEVVRVHVPNRSSIVIGKCLGGATVASSQGIIMILLAGVVHVPYDPLLILGIFGLQLLLAFAITAFGVMIAVRIKQMQSFFGVMQMIVMPMF